MTRITLLATCVLVSLCGGCGSDAPDDGRAEAEVVNIEDLRITVSGKVALLPEAAQYLGARNLRAPTLEGLPVRVEEPLRVAVNDPDAPLATGSIGGEGSYRLPDVPVKQVLLSLSVGVGDGSGQDGLMRTSTVLFDTALTQTGPRRDLVEAQAYALPLRYVEALSFVLGGPRILALTEGRTEDLRDAGFLLGRVVDAAGQPVAGARVVALGRPELAGHIFYPSGDAGTVDTQATDASGLFLYVHSAGDAETFKLGVEGAAGTYVPRNAGASRGLGIVMTVSP